MFAVPGWSISSSTLKAQTSETSKSDQNQVIPSAKDVTGDGKRGQKRKRSNGGTRTLEVDPKNLAELWETVIEKKTKSQHESRTEANRKQPGTIFSTSTDYHTPNAEAEKAEKTIKIIPSERRKTLKEKKREKRAKIESNLNPPTRAIPVDLSSPTIAAKLTPLQVSMRQKLVSARFRHLNQTLYTTSSSHSLGMFQTNPEMFQEYHEGFRKQVEVWPENPVDSYIQQIRQRGKVRGHFRKSKASEPTASEQTTPNTSALPRTDGTCYIADLGCGDAKLSSSLEKEKRKLKVEVFSYDLLSTSSLVTKADIADLPLKDGSLDVAIFCLALMGTNWVDFIEEAFRILRWKGELWVAEIKSRFVRVGGKGQRVLHSVGNRKKPDQKAAKQLEQQQADSTDLLVEVDGYADQRAETDVSAFVEVLRKRGFALRDEKAVDLSNKMFVKMTFIKSLTPIKGKGVPVPKGMSEMGLATWAKKPKTKFLEGTEEVVSSEASVLKPCVYKLR